MAPPPARHACGRRGARSGVGRIAPRAARRGPRLGAAGLGPLPNPLHRRRGLSLDDYRWLTGEEAAAWLRWAAAESAGSPARVKRLRAAVGLDRARLVLQQVELRRRAKRKFGAAERMFFLPRALEQATGERIARYKAERFGRGGVAADLCCGIGGDLLALADRGPVVGYERDPILSRLAEANCLALDRPEARVRTADARQASLAGFAAWHIDPDRRPGQRRTTRPDRFEPSWSDVQAMLAANPHGAVKLAPASHTPPTLSAPEREWIGAGGQCPQQVAWFGSLAQRPGQRVATVLDDSPAAPRTLVGQSSHPPPAERLGHWIYEPHPAILAARLVGTLARQHGLQCAAPNVAYLTGDQQVCDPALAAYRVREVLPFDLKKLRGLLRSRNIGRLEIKKRAVPLDPERVRKELRLRGDGQAVLLLAPIRGRVAAIVATRPAFRGGRGSGGPGRPGPRERR